ncbi:MAG: PorV/PorQ family protein [Bacteroidetes bacterium]|nr:PorV/PorQ family protein [Bacteroidota bacterium]
MTKLEMKNFVKSILLVGFVMLLTSNNSLASDEARFGTAGAPQLTINGWARSSGWGNANVGGIRGAESFFFNPAGLAKTAQTELVFARTAWLMGTGISINNVAFTQNIGKSGSDVIGISLMSYEIGNINITTVQQPDGGLGTYRPSFMNLGFGYGKKFTKSISGGIVARIVQEQIPDVRMVGVCFDAGVQYAASSNPNSKVKKDDLKFGISLRNIGPNMRPSGDGLTKKSTIQGAGYESSMFSRADEVQLPSLINIGGSYDFKLDKDPDVFFNRLTLAANYNFNAFSPNLTTVGLEYAYKEIFMIRTGYNFQQGGFNYETRNDALTGFCAGATVEIPLGGKGNSDNKSTLAVDYSYRSTNPFNGVHSFGLRINIDSKGHK